MSLTTTQEMATHNFRWFLWAMSLLVAIAGVSDGQRQYRWLLIVSLLVLFEFVVAFRGNAPRKVLELLLKWLGVPAVVVTLAVFGYPLGALLDYQNDERSVNLFVSLALSLIVLGLGNGSIEAALNKHIAQEKAADTVRFAAALDRRFASALADQRNDLQLALLSIETRLLNLEVARKRRWWRSGHVTAPPFQEGCAAAGSPSESQVMPSVAVADNETPMQLARRSHTDCVAAPEARSRATLLSTKRS